MKLSAKVILILIGLGLSPLHASEKPYAYPVPWIPYDAKGETGNIQDGITFRIKDPSHIPCTIKIYSSSGKKVDELTIDKEESTWEIGQKRETVSSGIYIYSVEKNNVSIGRGKLIVIW